MSEYILELDDEFEELEKNTSSIYFFIKRFFDIILSFLAILFLLPVFLIVAILIKIDSPGKIIFAQERVGKNGSTFKMYKFRSMYIDAEEKLASLKALNERSGPVFKIKNDPRITKVGKFIRKTCIDELPQLFNILLSDMSIVGPRPALKREVVQYTEHQRSRLVAKPGLTCYWQISDRNMDFDGWVDLDVKYIKERNILVDIKIIAKTFLHVLHGEGEK